jgi:steroid 5-alpha reductase family enzyme
MFLPAYFLRTDKLTDISYALTFVLLAGYGLFSGGVSGAKLLAFLLVTAWAVRLGSYLLYRIHKMGKDKRFDERRNNFLSFGSFWILQGVSVWVVLLPTLFFLQLPSPQLGWLSLLGGLIWAVGLVIETLADWQKFQFISNPANKGNWIASGVWRYSRHPNYFGEILVWVGMYLVVVSPLAVSAALFGLVSPVYIATLLIFVSGIPLLEKSADAKWGDNPAYQQYKKQTSPLVLLPLRS